jgi:hypothetical protein
MNHPFAQRRLALGLTLDDVQAFLSRRGFQYSVDLISALERGERTFPVENPGFILAMSEVLQLSAASLRQTAQQITQAMRAERRFWNRIEGLRPQNKLLLNLVLKHPDLTLIPGFNLWFELSKSVLLQMPDRWFVSR